MLKDKYLIKVMARCITMVGRDSAFPLPETFASHFKRIPEADVYASLDYLSEMQYITVTQPLIPTDGSRYAVVVNTIGKTFYLEKIRLRKEFLKTWRWNIYAAILAALLGACLARVSELIF